MVLVNIIAGAIIGYISEGLTVLFYVGIWSVLAALLIGNKPPWMLAAQARGEEISFAVRRRVFIMNSVFAFFPALLAAGMVAVLR